MQLDLGKHTPAGCYVGSGAGVDACATVCVCVFVCARR